jgi:hypothetical protein
MTDMELTSHDPPPPDLAAENPELVRELNEILEARLEDTGAVRPQRNPAFRAAVSAKEKNRAVQ